MTISLLAAATAAATPLSTSGALLLPTPCPGTACGPTNPWVALSITNNVTSGFDGTFSAPAAAAWQGTFHATASGVSSGPSYPSGAVGASTTLWNFSNLPNTYLPSGTFFGLGDVDNGSGQDERFKLIAYDNTLSVIKTPWLDEALLVQGAVPGELTQGSMPEYSWDGVNGVYTFDGNNVSINPTVTVWMATNLNMTQLSVQKFNTSYGLAVAAPTPEPASFAMIGLGLATLGLVRKRLRA